MGLEALKEAVPDVHTTMVACGKGWNVRATNCTGHANDQLVWVVSGVDAVMVGRYVMRC